VDNRNLPSCFRRVVAPVLFVVCSNGTDAGEKLYNGIVLPDAWPPKVEKLSLEPMPVPYLQARPAVIPIDVGRQFFVDDFLIEETTLKRTFHQLKPYSGNPVIVAEHRWEEEGQWKGKTGRFAIPFSDGVWFDPKDNLFKMWYMAGVLQRTCYAVSKDGLRWDKPSLDVRPGTNVVHPGNRDSATVWLDQDEKNPQKRFKMFRFQKLPRRGLVLHYSADGIHWGDEIHWASKCHDRTTVFYNPFRKVWVASIKATIPPKPPYLYAVRRFYEGTDPISALNWGGYGDPYLWLRTDRLEQMRNTGKPQHRIYNLDAVAYESLMLGMFSIYHGDGDGEPGSRRHMNDVCLGFSRDGFHWHRPDRRAFVGVGINSSDWNWTNVQSVGGCCLIVRDKLYVYYSGRNSPGVDNAGKANYGTASTGLGFLRRDGFASMDAGATEAVLTTCPVRFHGKHLFVNVNSKGGELRIEMLGMNGKAIASYTRAQSLVVRTDSTLQPVRWEKGETGGKDLSSLTGQPVRFRFYMKNARLYSFWVSPDESGASYRYAAAGGPGFTGSTDRIGSAGYNCAPPLKLIHPK